jgi:hypothetical protein
MTKTTNHKHKQDRQAMLAYGMCLSACRTFCDAIDTIDDVQMHRAAASVDKCVKSIATLMGPSKRLRRVTEMLQSRMKDVYAKYMYGMARDNTPLLDQYEQMSNEYRKFRRDLSRAEQQKP